MKGIYTIRWIIVLSMICLFLAGCEEQQESIQTSIDVEPTNIVELESEEESLEIEEKDFEIIVKYDSFNWGEVDFTYLPFKNQSEFENTVNDYIKNISEYTGSEDWYLEYGSEIKKCTITFGLLDNISIGSTNNLGGKTDPVRKKSDDEIYTAIHINRSHFEAGNTHLAHELTHVICITNFSQSICEGLCDYLARKYEGEKSSYYKLKCKSVNDFLKGYYEPVIKALGNEEVKEYENFKPELMNSIGSIEKGYSYGLSGIETSMWFNFSESFVGYLIEEYGIDKFMDLYKNGKTKEDYIILNPEGYEKIQNDWIKMYNEYEPQIDYEEVKKDAEAFNKRYNKE